MYTWVIFALEIWPVCVFPFSADKYMWQYCVCVSVGGFGTQQFYVYGIFKSLLIMGTL